MPAPTPPASWYRTEDHPDIWHGKGKVAAVGIGHSPTARRWDWTPPTSVGGLAIGALRKAMEDAGVSPADVDGLVLDQGTTTGAHWPEGRDIPADWNTFFPAKGDNVNDGMDRLSHAWILGNMPELSNVTFTMQGPGCMSNAVVVAAEAVARGLTHTCLVLKGWHNMEGRYYQGGANAQPTVSGGGKYSAPWAGPASLGTALQFQRYLHKYGKTHDMMYPFMIAERRNGLNFPEGYWAQNRPEMYSLEDYISTRWVAKPANLLDNDIPIVVAAAYLFTTPERARNMKQKPVYILNVARDATRSRGLTPTLEEVEDATYRTGRKIYEGAGITEADLSFENMYDGFTLFHVFHLEGLRFAGVQPGEALDFFATEPWNDSWKPVSPSGGNHGSGRTRIWMHTDSIQQIQGRAGQRQIRRKAEIGVSGGPMPTGGNFTVWSATPD
ncbi:MAG: hypothetical protein HYZ81_00110 [Nitrospinae bacterium]|nr:hypothetical protein [Nitrospinota bacterium]